MENRGAQRREIYHDFFIILFTHYVQVVIFQLERSGHQVSLNDPTSHQHFTTLRSRQSQSRWPCALRLAGCNEPIYSYNFYISDFLYRWPNFRSISWPSHYKSMGENQVAHFFTNTPKSKLPWMASVMTILAYLDYFAVTALRSCDVIRGHQNIFFC